MADRGKLLRKIRYIEFIVSNPGFEIWFLLHFTYTTKHYKNCDDVIKDLKRHISDYDKNKDIYEQIEKSTFKALHNTDSLDKAYANQKWPSLDCNPRTDVGRLLRHLVS